MDKVWIHSKQWEKHKWGTLGYCEKVNDPACLWKEGVIYIRLKGKEFQAEFL